MTLQAASGAAAERLRRQSASRGVGRPDGYAALGMPAPKLQPSPSRSQSACAVALHATASATALFISNSSMSKNRTRCGQGSSTGPSGRLYKRFLQGILRRAQSIVHSRVPHRRFAQLASRLCRLQLQGAEETRIACSGCVGSYRPPLQFVGQRSGPNRRDRARYPSGSGQS